MKHCISSKNLVKYKIRLQLMKIWGMKMKSRNNLFLILGIVFAIIFIFAANLAKGNLGASLDESFANWADGQSTAFVTKIMDLASIIGSSEVIMLITVAIGVYFLIKRSWRHFFFFFVLSVGGVILNLALKMLIQRARPGDEAKFIEVFNYTFELQSYSFPSGHTMRVSILILFLIYLAIYALKNMPFKIGLIIIYLGILISVALSRIMLDAHFATDVLGAIIVSIAWFFLCFSYFYKLKELSFSMYK